VTKFKSFLNSNVTISLGLFLFALSYYFVLSCKNYTWIFMSGDSADWLAQARLWFLPQPYGAPIFIMLAKAINLIGGNLAKNMVFYLSCLPSAISVVLVYFATLKVKGSRTISIVVALVMIGAFPYLAESTVIREHALAAMFVAAAVLAWSYRKYPFVLMFMGLATAVNIIPLYLTGIWAFTDLRKHWKDWLKWSWIFILVGVAPYSLTLYIMGHSQYKWWEGAVTLANIQNYLGTTATIANLSIGDFKGRLLDFVAVISVSYGLALVPAVKGFIKQWKVGFVAVAVFWLYLMDIDPSTWTFTLYAVPMMALLIAAGLNHKKEIIAVGICACVLIGINGIFLNAQSMDNRNPVAMQLYNDTMALPDGAVVVTNQGGFVTLGQFYAISTGKHITLDFATAPAPGAVNYQDWLKWANTQGLHGNDSIEIAQNALNEGLPVYRITTYIPEINASDYVLQPFNHNYDKVVAIEWK
jgi:hypothetical protein